MTKQSVRILFTGDQNEVLAKWFYESINLSGFYRAVELDPEHEDAVLIEFNQFDKMAQAQYIATLLTNTRDYRFVGPKCPDYHNTKHHQAQRFMVAANFLGTGYETACFGCRKKLPASFYGTFYEEKDFRVMLLLETVQKVRPMPSPKATVPLRLAIDTETTGLKPGQSNMKISKEWQEAYMHKTDRFHTQQITKSEKNKIAKDCVGCDYEKLELATLFHTLGIRNAVDVKTLADLEYAAQEGGEWLDSGGGAVLLINPNDNQVRAKATVGAWMRRNQSSERYCLALVEVDKVHLDQDIFNSEAVQKAAADFSARQDLRRHMKKHSFSIDRSELRKLCDISEQDAKNLIDAYYKAWPGLKKYQEAIPQNITDLTVKNRDLQVELTETKDSLDNAYEAIKVLHEDIRKLKEKQTLEPDNYVEEPSDLVTAADDFLRFMAGVNMQDHSIQEQRDFNSKFSALKTALMRLGIGSTPGKKKT